MNEPKLKTNADLSPTEAIVDSVAVRDSACHGCQKTGTFAMISGTVMRDPRKNHDPEFYDLFLTREQVERLRVDLGKLLERNR